MKDNYLASDWIDTIPLEMLLLTLAACPAGTTFWDYYNCIQSLNSLLIDTDSFQKEPAFCQKVEAGLDAELTQKCHAEKCHEIMDIQAWSQAVKSLDDA